MQDQNYELQGELRTQGSRTTGQTSSARAHPLSRGPHGLDAIREGHESPPRPRWDRRELQDKIQELQGEHRTHGAGVRVGIDRRAMLALSGGHLAVDFASG